MNQIPTVVIVGGGASGVLIGTNLLTRCHSALKIVIVNSGYNLGTGVAYHPASDKHLLNVMTGKMSVFPDDPDHFVRWLINDHSFSDIEIETLAKTYLPRKIYGEYLLSVWNEALKRKRSGLEVNIIAGRALDIQKKEQGGFSVQLADGLTLDSDYVVLASGNAPPRNPDIPNKSFYKSKNYFNNPWLASSVEDLESDQDVLIIGNGLTMVDTTLSLVEKKHKGIIHSLSPNGFGILQHRHNGVTYNGLMRELGASHSLAELVRLFNKHVKKVRRLGLSAEPVIDSLRPRTQSLWMAFSLEEKRKFVSRLRHLWGVARHRLPIQIFDLIQRLKIDGKLKIWAGRISNILEEDHRIRVDFFDKKSKTVRTLSVSRVINCTGPETDVEKMNDPLFINLLKSGLISPDPLKMGIEADPASLLVLNQEHRPVDSFFVIGGLLRGLLWESTAMPEIRVQARQIADQISKQIELRK
jgi:uncharacterized NAD(P)/FAD-binding protein YdhS